MKKKVILEFKVNSEKIKELMNFLENNLENVRSFKGCSLVKVYYNADDSKMIFDETWKTTAHHKEYLNFITENGIMEKLLSFTVSTPEIKYFDIVNL